MPRVDTTATLSQNIYQSFPLYVKYVVDSKIDLAYFASANGINVKQYGDLNNLVNDIKARNIPVEPFRVTGMELSMPCIRETPTTQLPISCYPSQDMTAVPFHCMYVKLVVSCAQKLGELDKWSNAVIKMTIMAVCSLAAQPFGVGSVPPAWGSVHLPCRSLHHKPNTYVF